MSVHEKVQVSFCCQLVMKNDMIQLWVFKDLYFKIVHKGPMRIKGNKCNTRWQPTK